MTWQKKVEGRTIHGKAYHTVVTMDDGGILVSCGWDEGDGYQCRITSFLTINQAGDLAHALQEAIQKATEVKP